MYLLISVLISKLSETDNTLTNTNIFMSSIFFIYITFPNYSKNQREKQIGQHISLQYCYAEINLMAKTNYSSAIKINRYCLPDTHYHHHHYLQIDDAIEYFKESIKMKKKILMQNHLIDNRTPRCLMFTYMECKARAMNDRNKHIFKLQIVDPTVLDWMVTKKICE